jgi:hypothetical protein
VEQLSNDTTDTDALLETMRRNREDIGEGFLANVVLIDLPDSPTRIGDSDSALHAEIKTRLAAANEQASGPPLAAPFHACRWNSMEQVWMGWERKRALAWAAPFLALCFVAPQIAYWTARPIRRPWRRAA